MCEFYIGGTQKKKKEVGKRKKEGDIDCGDRREEGGRFPSSRGRREGCLGGGRRSKQRGKAIFLLNTSFLLLFLKPPPPPLVVAATIDHHCHGGNGWWFSMFSGSLGAFGAVMVCKTLTLVVKS